MQLRLDLLYDVIFGRPGLPSRKVRRSRRAGLVCESLEGRVVPSHVGVAHHAVAHLHTAAHHAHADASHTKTGTATTSSTSTSASAVSTTTSLTGSTATAAHEGGHDSGNPSNSALSTAAQTLQKDIQTIQQGSGTTVGELTAISAAFQTLSSDGLYPSSESALRSFENSLVTTAASGTTLAGDTAILGQFQALYTSSPTTQQTTDLTAAYNTLAAAVTSANITSANITTINTDWAAVQAARGSTSTVAFPYFSLVTVQGGRHGFGFGEGGQFGGGYGQDGDFGGSSASTLSTAIQTLRNDVQTIELASGTTVGQLATIASSFQTLSSDGLSPSSQSALRSFENSLVTAAASGTTLAGDSTLLSQFEALYTSSPTTQQTTDLTTAYNALAAAVTSSNITAADITTINTDWAAVLAAVGSTSTSTYPYFNLVTGQGNGLGGPDALGMGGGC